jgi:hypothetical protein
LTLERSTKKQKWSTTCTPTPRTQAFPHLEFSVNQNRIYWTSDSNYGYSYPLDPNDGNDV